MGARNRATVAAMALLEGEAERLARKAVELALGGDVAALRLCLDHILPKGRTVRLALPLGTLADLDAATLAVGEALAQGVVSIEEAGDAGQADRGAAAGGRGAGAGRPAHGDRGDAGGFARGDGAGGRP